MSEERKMTVEPLKTIEQQSRLTNRPAMITTVFAAAALALFTLAWTGRCPLAAAGLTAAVNRTNASADPSPATDTDDGNRAADGETAWLIDLDRALATATKLNRPVLIDFAASWCAPCQMMEKHVWPKEKVREVLAEHVVPLKVDMDAAGARSLVQRYSIQFVPTVLLVDARGDELDRVGYVGADELVEFVNEVRSRNR